MNPFNRAACIITLATVFGVPGAFAQSADTIQSQTEPMEHQWSRGATLALSGGVGTASDSNGMLLGGVIGWDITPRIGLEGLGMWMDKQPGASAFGAAIGVRAELTESHPTGPFVSGGFGLYLATYDPNRTTDIPSFYRDRISGSITNTFVDPAFFAAAGFDLYRSQRLAIRPAFGASLAVRDSRTYAVGTFTVRVEYHFMDNRRASSR
jgi:hypothetical protein